jgi:hypothetical protein
LPMAMNPPQRDHREDGSRRDDSHNCQIGHHLSFRLVRRPLPISPATKRVRLSYGAGQEWR